MNYLFSSEAAIAKKILHDTGYVEESPTDLPDLSPDGISARFSL